VHRVLAKRCGAKGTTLPILLIDKKVVEGSGVIMDSADQRAQDRTKRLTLAGALEIEQRADNVIGVQARRLAYAEMLPGFPHLVKTALFRNASSAHRVIGALMWPLTRRIMMRSYELTSEGQPKAARGFKSS
jgi:hypothetical protein